MKCNGSLSAPFTASVDCGVCQGCPLSVTLFNLFIADLDAYLKSKCTPGTGVQVVREHESRSKPPTEWHRHLAAPDCFVSAVCGALDVFEGLVTVCPLCWLPWWPVYVRHVT